MRTKTILLSAAVLAAGLSASVAQSVFSVNAVGYVNLPIQRGYNLIANPLNGTNNSINTVIPTAPDDTLAFEWNNASQSFGGGATFVTGSGWLDSQFNPSPIILNPGEGFFIQNVSAAAFTLTFVGEVPQGTLVNNLLPNYGFYSSIVPQSAGLSTIGFPAIPDAEYTEWNVAGQRYGATFTFIGIQPGFPTGWVDSGFNSVDPTPVVGLGFLLRNPSGAAVAWNRTFSVN